MIPWILAVVALPCSALAQFVPAPAGETTTQPTDSAKAPSSAPAAAAAPATGSTTPAGPSLPATFDGRLRAGHLAYLRDDAVAALSAYQEAKAIDSGKPVVYYFIGCAQAKDGRVDEAIASLRTAATIAGSDDLALHGKALMMVAVLEEGRGDLAAAKQAWGDYAGFARTHADAKTFPATAEARISAIDRKLKLDEDYKVVLDRIASAGK